MMMVNVIWKSIPGYEGMYEVSNAGQLRRLRHNGAKLLHPAIDSKGYKIATLYKDGKGKSFRFHRLIMYAFYGESDLQVNHKDGNKTNNNLSNLEYCTARENTLHGWRVLGRESQKGEEHSRAKLSTQQVKEIVAMLRAGYLHRQIAEALNIAERLVSTISCKSAWTHLEEVQGLPDFIDRLGENNPASKLTTSDVVEIKRLLNTSVPVVEIASRFGVNPSTIHKIRRGERWGHIVL